MGLAITVLRGLRVVRVRRQYMFLGFECRFRVENVVGESDEIEGAQGSVSHCLWCRRKLSMPHSNSHDSREDVQTLRVWSVSMQNLPLFGRRVFASVWVQGPGFQPRKVASNRQDSLA